VAAISDTLCTLPHREQRSEISNSADMEGNQQNASLKQRKQESEPPWIKEEHSRS
jgi:hypothetical protein